MTYVYVLHTEDWKNHYYVGVTSHLERRVQEHNAGENASTKGARWRLVYCEGYVGQTYALKRERKLKTDRRVWRFVKKRIEESLE